MNPTNETPAAKPLARTGRNKICEQRGNSRVPPLGVSGKKLTALWREIIEAVRAQGAGRDLAIRTMLEAEKCGDWASANRSHLKAYRATLVLEEMESVAALIHEILAPAAFLCDAGCKHVLAGATPVQAKRVLDSLEAEVVRIQLGSKDREWSQAAPGGYHQGLGVLHRGLSCFILAVVSTGRANLRPATSELELDLLGEPMH